jgi:Flp pilus assembly protein TadG
MCTSSTEKLQLDAQATAGVNAGKPGGLLRRLRRDKAGSVGMLFGLVVIPLTAFVGLAVDFGRVYAVKSQTQSALDAAALAAGRVAQVDKTDTLNKASSAATAYFDKAKPASVVSSVLQFSPDAGLTQFTVTATSWVRTPFLGVLHAWTHKTGSDAAPDACKGNYFGCVGLTTTATAALCPSTSCIGTNSGGSNIEVSLMLDVTGSMCDPCTKITAVKKAAKDLIDIVVWDDQSQYTSRVALAPFADAVNVGATLAPQVRGTVTANNSTGSGSSGPQLFTSSSTLNDTSNQPTKKWIRFNSVNGSNSNGCTTSGTDNCTWQIHSKCVTERVGVHAYDDTVPNTAVANTLVGKGYFSNSATSGCAVADHADPEVNLIMPMTKDRTALKARIDKLDTGGSTAGHLGTAWAYYLLSPKWNGLFPAASAAGPYSDLTVYNSKGMPKLRKIAVLMTDGDYNINYCKGVEAKNSDQSPDINCNSENGKSQPQAASLCSALKNAKIEVFAVGFQVSSAAKTFLTSCATDASHYYDATTDVALQAAFRDIALKIATLRLTN